MAKNESVVARALCQLLEADMIAKGMSPSEAKILAGRACEVGVVRAGRATKAGAKKVARKASRGAGKMRAALKQANSKLRTKSGKLRKGKTQADVMRLAHKIRRRM